MDRWLSEGWIIRDIKREKQRGRIEETVYNRDGVEDMNILVFNIEKYMEIGKVMENTRTRVIETKIERERERKKEK